MNNCKNFADKGVQTDSIELSPGQDRNEDPHPLSGNPSPSNRSVLDTSRSSEYLSVLHSLDGLGAYTCLEGPDTTFPGDARHISARPEIKLQRLQIYGQLSYNRPTQVPFSSNRIVSLPETSPPCRIGGTSGSTTRFVSMPEHLKVLGDSVGSPGDRQLEYSEHLGISPTSDGKTNSRDSDILLRRAPQTPSPPSSPESVMIIGNNAQVPQAFLRPKAVFDNVDNGGWIPWKSSPPKPIPALHGPLSLPYARCPSGAEGTVVEGEDLSHMIWGLESNSLHSANAKGHSSALHGHKISPRHEASPRLPEPGCLGSSHDPLIHNFRNQDVIDLCRPEFYAPLQSSRSNRTQNHQSLRPHLGSSEDSLLFNRETRRSIHDFTIRDSPIQLYPSSLGHLQTVWNAGLGLDVWKGPQGSDIPLVTEPSFSMSYGESLYFPSEPAKASQLYQTPRAASVYDVQSYDSQRYRTGIPTPPNTCSPQWSPRFRQAYFSSLSPETQYEQVTTPQLPRFTSTTGMQRGSLDPDQMINSYLHSEPESPPVPNLDVEIDHRASCRTDFGTSSLASGPTLDCHDDIRPLPKYRSPYYQLGRCIGPAPPSPVSPDIRVPFSHQQPRSIPLTRLIQRRLSSVAEEETADARLVGSPPPSQELDIPSPRTVASFKTGKEGERLMERNSEVILDASARLTNTAKRSHKLPDYSLRRIPMNIARKGRKPLEGHSPATNNRFSEQRGEDTASCERNMKPNKPYKKKRARKQPDT